MPRPTGREDRIGFAYSSFLRSQFFYRNQFASAGQLRVGRRIRCVSWFGAARHLILAYRFGVNCEFARQSRSEHRLGRPTSYFGGGWRLRSRQSRTACSISTALAGGA
jgi:hypothetical protein